MTDIPKRPTRYSRGVRLKAIESILAVARQWLDDHDGGADNDDDLGDVLLDQQSNNAFEWARSLSDYRHWDADADLVAILDGFSDYGAFADAIKKWITENDIKVPYSVGDTGTLRNRQVRIVRIDADMANIIAQPVIPDGQEYGDIGGWVHPFEDFELDRVIPTPPKETA